MPLNMNKTPSSNDKQRALIPKGQHMARIVQIIDLGLQPQRPYKGQEKAPAYELYITFEFPNQRIEIDGESRPMWKSRRIKVSTNEKSTCYKWYFSLDPENMYGGDWSKLIEKECAVLIAHDQGQGKNEGRVFDRIADIVPVMEGVSVPPLENDSVLFDLMSPVMEVFENMPDWLQNLIKENLEFDGSKLQTKLEGNPTKWTARAPGDAPEDVDGDEVPDPVTVATPESEDDPW